MDSYDVELELEIEDLRIQLAEAQKKLSDFKLANSAVTEGIWLCKLANGDPDDAGSEIIWSKQFRKLLGYEKIQDFPNNWNSWVNAVHKDDIDKTYVAFSNHLNDKTGNTPYTAEYRMKSADRGYVWFRERAATMRDESGLAIVTAGAIRDISDEYNAKELHQLNLKNTEQSMLKISDIAETVNQIAMQLTILSMNAKIEAARAGQAGRGFAVVAGEVSKLATHTHTAMNEIRKMADAA